MTRGQKSVFLDSVGNQRLTFLFERRLTPSLEGEMVERTWQTKATIDADIILLGDSRYSARLHEGNAVIHEEQHPFSGVTQAAFLSSAPKTSRARTTARAGVKLLHHHTGTVFKLGDRVLSVRPSDGEDHLPHPQLAKLGKQLWLLLQLLRRTHHRK